jgi:hypothetical protein
VPERRRSLPFSSPRMSRLSPLSATLAIQQRLDLVVAVSSPVDVDSAEAVAMPEEAGPASNESVKAVEDKHTTTTTAVGAVVVLVVEGDLDGRITTSHSATVMLLSTLSLIGRCWRRLISTVLPS